MNNLETKSKNESLIKYKTYGDLLRKIKQLIKELPNDAKLGAEIRKLYKE